MLVLVPTFNLGSKRLHLLRHLYSLLFVLAMPLVILRLLVRSRQNLGYRQRILERAGMFKADKIQPGGIWLHAVSVGEVVAAIPLVNALLTKYPDLQITLTTMTPTGSQRVKQSLGSKVHHVYLPYDIPWFLSNFLARVKPSCVIVMETELWPNMFAMCAQRKIPILVANGRISDVSLPKYLRFKFFISYILDQVNIVAAQSKLDGERFLALGLDPKKLRVVGNLKYDVRVPLVQNLELDRDLVLVAASTHPGEEEQVLDALQRIQTVHPQCLLILVPRHPERFDAVAQLLERRAQVYVRRSQSTEITPATQVLLGDTMGELNTYYANADLAFVGGSLVNIGGHNLLEPAALGLAAITGPYVANFKEISANLQAAAAVRMVQDSDDLAKTVLELFADENLRLQMGRAAKKVVEDNRGALDNIMTLTASLLPQA